jgi:hypothetical protein
MHAVATPAVSLTILVPRTLLPTEGDELVLVSQEQRVGNTTDLFTVFQELAATRAATFVMHHDDVSYDGDLDDDSTLQLLTISPEPESHLPLIEARPAMSYFDWAGVIREVGHAMLNEHFLGTPDELARVFSEAVREVSSIAAAGFKGEAVPLITVKLEDGAAKISFLGIWLADGPSIEEVRRTIPGASWQESTGLGQSSCLLLDAAEVEGRGLKEAVLSAALLAMVFGSATSAQAADPITKPTNSRLASFFGGDSRPGDVLPVKSQKLVQEAPRVYKEVMARQHSDLRIVIVIGQQRAYMLKDGAIAFETPISSGRGPRMTKRGTFTITEKVRSGKMSTIYKCPLPGWMRIGEMPIGMHEGDLPGYPASHGCVRMPIESAHFIFDNAPKGTTVQIVDNWAPPVANGSQVIASN